ncbi:hypothetical protein YC2023_077061 [Brassica napus]
MHFRHEFKLNLLFLGTSLQSTRLLLDTSLQNLSFARHEFTEALLPLGTSSQKGEGSCSIFKIPQSLKKYHQKGYEPEIVSIGPYHHGKEHLQMLEEHKHRYLKLFLGEAKDGVDTNTLGRKILQMETAIRNS